MKKQSGVTLITLAITIVVLGILATITIINSVDTYLRMNFENYLAQLDELQAAVDNMCEKYKTEGYTSYLDAENGFFIKKYNKIPGTLAIAENKENARNVILKYFNGNPAFHDGFVFYFSADEVEEYFNIKGIEFDIIVDFSTRYVYSVEGKKSVDSDEIIYSLLDTDSSHILQHDTESAVSSASGITFTQTSLNSGDTKMFEIKLVLNFSDDIGKYDIKKAYYSKDDREKWIEVDYLGDCKYTKDTVTFYIYEPGTYYFKIEDTSGKVTTNIQNGIDSVYTTLNF